MKQVLQNLKNGEVVLADLPVPRVGKGEVLIQTSRSLISLGTEKMLLNFGKSGWVNKARQQPDKVKQVLQKVKTDGLVSTVEAVQNKLDQPIPLGYSNVGIVIKVGEGVSSIKVGDRVVSNGNHAELVVVPENLCCKIPDNVSDEEASFTVVSAIGLQGIRLMNPTLGETVVVLGLGLIGLLTCQILKANGVKVVGLDIDPSKVELAKKFGVHSSILSNNENAISIVNRLTDDMGADGVIITASANSNGPIELSPKLCRKRGKVVLVGVVGLDISRADFFEKEITFQVSCSYGPGRYDPNYEKKGLDYPIGYVRWTENRNFVAILELMSSRAIDLNPLISKRVSIDNISGVYDKLNEDKNSLGIIIEYPSENPNLESREVTLPVNHSFSAIEEIGVGIVGSGNFTISTILPTLSKLKIRPSVIVSATGLKSFNQAKKYGIKKISSEYNDVLNDRNINSILITTPHNLHAQMASKALLNGKAVYLEKPLAITEEGHKLIEETLKEIEGRSVLTVGFNRRFSPYIQKIKDLVSNDPNPMNMVMTVNAGFIPKDHWTQDESVGGGRLLGEGCHFVDLLRFLAASKIIDSQIVYMESQCRDSFSIILKFESGSTGTIHYFANGHKSIPKERLEVFISGKVLEMNNYRSLRGYGFSNFKKMKSWSMKKGHQESLKAFFGCLKTGRSHIPIEEIIEVSKVCLKLANS